MRLVYRACPVCLTAHHSKGDIADAGVALVPGPYHAVLHEHMVIGDVVAIAKVAGYLVLRPCPGAHIDRNAWPVEAPLGVVKARHRLSGAGG